MNDYIMLNLFRQREKEISKELEGIRLLRAQHAGNRKKGKELWGRLRLIMASWKTGICCKASQVREMIDPLHLKDQKMQHHPEL